MKKYDFYKDSGVEWVGDIPSHWEFLSLKSLCDLNTNTISKEELNEKKLIHYSIPNVQEYRRGVEEEGNDIDSSKIILNGGEVLLSKLNPRKSCVTIVGNEESLKVGSGEFLSFLPEENKLINRFLFYLFKNQRFTEYLDSSVESVTRSHQRVRPEVVYLSKIGIPPLSEQHQIVSYLDRKTAQIDSLIEKTQRKIELLKENRTSLINEAVTKGLDPNVEMKDSGVEWIGEIPSHWITPKLNYISNKITDGEHISPKFTESGIPFLSSKDVRETGVDMSVNKFVAVEDSIKMRKRCNPEFGDVLVVGRGNSIGRISIVNTNEVFCLLGSVILLKHKNERVLNKFLFFYLQSPKVFEQLINTSSHSVQPTIYLEGIKNQIIILPPLSEQHQIVSYLDVHTQLIDKTVSVEERRIELLKAYRQSLISEVVTGKRKVTTDE